MSTERSLPDVQTEKSLNLVALVRNTRSVLVVQIGIALVAVTATGVAALQLSPLLRQRDAVRQEVVSARAEAEGFKVAARTAATELGLLRDKIARARDATRYTSQAIIDFHNRRFKDAVATYNRALELDSENPWIFDLKSYSQFRGGDLEGAVESVSKALELSPGYLYGYVELTRYQCARGEWDAAGLAAKRAGARFGKAARNRYEDLFAEDGEFRRLCGARRAEILKQLL